MTDFANQNGNSIHLPVVPGITDQLVSAVSDYFLHQQNVQVALLHGSYAKGNARNDSDIDIAIIPEPGLAFSSSELALIATDLTMLLRKTVDVGLITSANLVFAKEALENGIPLFVRSKYYLDMMRMTLLSMYVGFCEDRKEVVNAWIS